MSELDWTGPFKAEAGQARVKLPSRATLRTPPPTRTVHHVLHVTRNCSRCRRIRFVTCPYDSTSGSSHLAHSPATPERGNCSTVTGVDYEEKSWPWWSSWHPGRNQGVYGVGVGRQDLKKGRRYRVRVGTHMFTVLLL